MATSGENSRAIHPGVRMGHVHLKVSDLERALRFYHEVLGFEVTQRYGKKAVFLSAGGYHHHIGFNTWESLGWRPPGAGTRSPGPARTGRRCRLRPGRRPRWPGPA